MNMQRKSEELSTAMQEYLDVDWSSVKHYFRRQIAKCVNECKSQASNAKKIVGTVRQSHGREKTLQNGAEDSDEDSDDWDSDFDDFEDEENEDIASEELNNNTIKCSLNVSDTSDNSEATSEVFNSKPLPQWSKFIPKPPDLPVISASVHNISEKNSIRRNNIPRPPLKRPPSQPPPPPISQGLNTNENQEDYEIPINSPPTVPPVSCSASTIKQEVSTISLSQIKSVSSLASSSSIVKDHLASATAIETYEIIQTGEENYEVVDAPCFETGVPVKPALPPRTPSVSSCSSPPPLPQKPRRFQDVTCVPSKSDGYRSYNRPKLPVKTEEDSSHESPSAVSTILNSLLGRRNSATPTSSPKLQHFTKETNDNVSLSNSAISSACSTDTLTSVSPNSDKEGFVIVGSSAFICNSSSVDVHKSMPSQFPIKSTVSSADEIAQNMATRPLPPVPKFNQQSSVDKQDIHMYPWFHKIEREVAESEIKNMNQNGAFLVRPSKRAGKENPYTLTVFQDGKVFHLNIRLRSDDTFALGKEKKKEKTFPSVSDLIRYHQIEPILLTSRGESAGHTILQVYPMKHTLSL